MRHAVVSGQFYSSDRTELKKQIQSFLSSLDVASTKTRDMMAAIVPHAGYLFSGKCAAYVYKILKDLNFDTFLIIGTNHSGLGSKISLSIEDFETPFGIIESDIELIEEIIVKSRKSLEIGVNEQAHRYEHSVEVQLPFLQQIQKSFKIVPIVMRDLSIKDIEKFGKILSEMVKENRSKGKKIFVLFSSDLTHYGRDYGFLPFKENIKENMYLLDGIIIDKILQLDTPLFIKEAERSTVCGKDVISCCIEFAKNLELSPIKLCYYASGDIIGKWDSVVGYSSIIFSHNR